MGCPKASKSEQFTLLHFNASMPNIVFVVIIEHFIRINKADQLYRNKNIMRRPLLEGYTTHGMHAHARMHDMLFSSLIVLHCDQLKLHLVSCIQLISKGRGGKRFSLQSQYISYFVLCMLTALLSPTFFKTC